jgi:aminoglycoside phosphotransferase (APT) family kinase protein
MRNEEIDRVAAALGRKVVESRTLAGGFSHETCLLTLDDSQVVARFGGGDPVVEAAVMRAAARVVPVPEVLLVRPAVVLEFVAGTPLSDVIDTGGADAVLGAEVGRVMAAIGTVAFGRPGFFGGPAVAGGHLDPGEPALVPGEMPPWSEQMPELIPAWTARAPESRLDAAAKRDWVALCLAHAPALTRIDDQARLVHADANPKNILVTRLPGGDWRVDAVLDWEFSHSGSPYADFANMTRFSDDYPAEFTDGFRSGFAAGRPDALTALDEQVPDWAYLGRVMDMFALTDLLTRPAGHPVADRAAREIRRWLRDGIPDHDTPDRNGIPDHDAK